MTTALDIIKRSLRLLGVYSIGEEPSAEESQDALAALNALLDSYANESLLIYAQSLDSIPLTANQPFVTVGPTGTFVTTRPVNILEASTVEYQSIKYPLQAWTLADYQSIILTIVGGIPCGIWPLMEFPNITIRPWPLPAAAMTLNLWSEKQITSFPTLTTLVTLPPGYERLFAFCLAEEIAPEYEVQPSATVMKKAAQARKVIKRTNTEIPRLQMPYGIPNGNNGWGGWQS